MTSKTKAGQPRSQEHQQRVLEMRRSSAASRHVPVGRRGSRAARKATALKDQEG